MPLLRRKQFVRKKLQDLEDNEEVFYCELTNEAFRDYEEFCQRVILCNSLVWSCSLTGKPQLTYQEALQSEEIARAIIKTLPRKLVIPLLYLASQTKKSSFGDLADEVFMFAKERYFVGEDVEINIAEDTWCKGCILRIFPSSEKEISKYYSENRDVETNLPPAHLFNYKVKWYERSREGTVTSMKGNQIRRPKGLYTREKNRLLLKYYSEQRNKLWTVKDEAIEKYNILNLQFDQIFCEGIQGYEGSRKIMKTNFTSPNMVIKGQNNVIRKEKRQETIQKYFKSPGKPENSPKKTSVDKSKSSCDTVSPGKKKPFLSNNQKQTEKKPPKKFNSDSISKSPQKQQLAKKLKDKYKDAGNLKRKNDTKNLLEKHKLKKQGGIDERLTMEIRKQKLKEERKEKALEEKRRKLEEKLKEKAKLKEEKLRLAEFLKQWNRQREDLECEDLKELPVPTKINCAIPNENFGDFIMILEFLHSFGDILSFKTFFPGGVTFELVERALSVNEVAGPLSDIIQLLLTALFNMQEEEDDEILETDNQTAGLTDETGDITTSEAVKLATNAASWCQLYQGTPLNKVTLDSVTLTEVLRLHLLSSGGRSGEMSSKWRYQQRGGYTSLDDPGLMLRIQQPHILRALSVKNVCELALGDKLQILSCLINQILTYATVRDVIDERGEKVKQLRAEIKAYQVAELKKEREAAAIRLKERKEAKLKLKDAGGGTAAPSTTIVAPTTEVQAEEEEEVRKQRMDRESSRRKQDFLKKSRDLYLALFGHQVLPIGLDRAYRRFWLFSSVPGLFVENDEQWVGSCLPKPTPYNPTLIRSDDTLTYVRKLFEEEWNGGSGSDKENDAGEDTRPMAATSSNKKLLAEKNTSDTITYMNSGRGVNGRTTWNSNDEDSDKMIVTKEKLLICTADVNTCPVHGLSESVSRTTWAFFSKEEEINHLIECLNRRGIRESELRQALLQEKDQILQNVTSCPIYKLDQTQTPDAAVPEPRKSSRSQKYEDANLNFPPGTPADEILELTLREYILDMEEKIHMGGLGSLRVNIRNVWRQAINDKSYDKQCEKFVWGLDKNMKKDEVKDMGTNGGSLDQLLDKDTNINSCDIGTGYKDPSGLLEDIEPGDQENPVIHDLACAILQMAQSVEKKYLKKPLGVEEGSTDNIMMKRWEVSLMASTSFSQLFLHFSSLDNSIEWSRSALYAHCRVCRRRADAENMLLCDGCNKGHHLYCLKPKLIKVPQGDWYCPKCRPPEKVRASKKSRRLFSQESDEDEGEKKEKTQDLQNKSSDGKGICSTCRESGYVLTCDSCMTLFHPECVLPPVKKIPRGKWFCPKCKAGKDVNNVQSDLDLQPTRRSGRRSLEVDLDLPLNNAVLQDLLTDVMHHKDSWPFLRPVPRAQVPDYHLIIKRPMDFGKMKYKLNMLEYRNNSEFIADALLVFENCQMYNQVDAQEYKAGVRLGRYFEKKCRELGLQLKTDELRSPEAKKARLG